jgi:hypothetical protein
MRIILDILKHKVSLCPASEVSIATNSRVWAFNATAMYYILPVIFRVSREADLTGVFTDLSGQIYYRNVALTRRQLSAYTGVCTGKSTAFSLHKFLH